MSALLRLLRELFKSRIFRRLKTRSPDVPKENLCEAPVGRIAEEVIPELPVGRPTRQEPLPVVPAENSIPTETLPGASIRRPFLRKCFSESDITTTHTTEEPLPEPTNETSTPEEPQLKPSLETPRPQETDSEMPVEIHIPEERVPGSPSQSESSTTSRTVSQSPKPRPTARNNRLLALPPEIRLQIYDELLAIPRTLHMLEPDTWGESHLYRIQRFDRELFSTHGCWRYKYSSHCLDGGYYDPRTTTFAARFIDDETCEHLIWCSDTHRNAPNGVPTSAEQVVAPLDASVRPADGVYLIFPLCSGDANGWNELTWGEVLDHLTQFPETQMLELEFEKLCSLVTLLKSLLLERVPGWRLLRKLTLLRIRLRSGTGGPLALWDMMTLLSLAGTVREEMQRQVLLRRGPTVEIGW